MKNLEETLNEKVTSNSFLGGGSIADSQKIRTSSGKEYFVKSYSQSFNLPVIITRGNNVYGPHQYPEKLIPKLIHQILRGQKLTIHGNGKNTRNYYD